MIAGVQKFLLVCAFASTAAFGDVLSTEELRGLQSKLKASDWLSVELTQTKTSPTRPNRPVKAKGSASFAKPDRFVWNVGDPINEQTIFDGKQLFKIRTKEKVGVRYNAEGSESQELRRIVDLVLNMDSLFDHYNVQRAEMKGDLVEIELTPKAANEVARVDLILDTKRNFISRLSLSLKTKMTLAIDFSAPRREPLGDSTFRVADGIRVTELR